MSDDDDFPSQASMASDQEGCCSPHQECAMPVPEAAPKPKPAAQSHSATILNGIRKFVKLISR